MKWERQIAVSQNKFLKPCQMPRLMRSIDDLQASNRTVILRAWPPQNWGKPAPITDHRKTRKPCSKVRSIWPALRFPARGWIGKRSRTLKIKLGTDSS